MRLIVTDVVDRWSMRLRLRYNYIYLDTLIKISENNRIASQKMWIARFLVVYKIGNSKRQNIYLHQANEQNIPPFCQFFFLDLFYD